MLLTRRSLMFGAAALLLGGATSSCSLIDGEDEFPIREDVEAPVEALIQQSGRDHFQRLSIQRLALSADILTADGAVQGYNHAGLDPDDPWEKGQLREKTLITSPSAHPLSTLPLMHLKSYVAMSGEDLGSINLEVDYAGKITVSANGRDGAYGIATDGSRLTPRLRPDHPEEAKKALAEMLSGYGTAVSRLGSFNGFVHVDLNYPDIEGGLRVVRYPLLAPSASLTDEVSFAEKVLFDPTDFDPQTAIERMRTITDDAQAEGKVWDWSYMRPPGGGDPQVSYGIGPSSPTHRVWIDEQGKIIEEVEKGCKAESDFCPQ